MKPQRFLPVLLIAGSLLQETVHADWRYRRIQYRYPRYNNYPRPLQPTNRVNTPAQSEEKPVKFKDIPLNTEFYFLADKNRKLFPRIKISNTAARTVPTPANPHITTNAIPVDTLVIEKKDDRKKSDSKTEGAKSDSNTKKEGNKPK